MAKKPAPPSGDIQLAAGHFEWLEAAAGEESAPKSRRFSMTAYSGGEVMLFGIYRVVINLASAKFSGPVVPVLIEHENTINSIAGRSNVKQEDITQQRVKMSGELYELDAAEGQSDPRLKLALSLARRGHPLQASVGGAARYVEVREGETVKINGRNFEGLDFVAEDMVIREVSLCAMGADPNTAVNIAAMLKGNVAMEFTAWLAAKGITSEPTDAAILSTLKAAWEAESNPKPTPVVEAKGGDGSPPVSYAKQRAAEIARTAAIEAKFGGKHAELMAKAVEHQWDDERIGFALEAANRPTMPAIHVANHDVNPLALKAGLCQTLKLSSIEKHFDDKTLQAAHTRYRGRLSMKSMLLEAAWEQGYEGRHFDKSWSGMERIIRLAFSTVSLPGILSDTANKFAVEGWNSTEQVWREIARTRSVNDFKEVKGYRLNSDLEFEEIGKGGELKHGELTENEFSNQAKTRGKMLTITREDIINDDLGLLGDLPRQMSRGAGIKLNNVFWTEWLDDAAFFTTARGNLTTGTPTALSLTSLDTAKVAFAAKVDEHGQKIGLKPQLMLVPTALGTLAGTIFKSGEYRDTTASTKYPTANDFAGKYRPVESQYLTSSTAWWLLANPLDCATIEACFLDGQETPTIETAEANFNVLGIQMRGILDFGVRKQDFQGGHKMLGAAP